MSKDYVEDYFEAQGLINCLLDDKGFYFEGELVDYRDWSWTMEMGESGVPYYLGFDEFSKFDVDSPSYSVDDVIGFFEYKGYTFMYVHNNGDKYAMVFSNDKFVKRED